MIRTLLLHAGALGDCVLAIQALRSLRISGRPLQLALCARSSIASWAARHGIISEFVPFDRLMQPLYGFESESDPARSESVLRPADWIVSFLGGADEPISHELKKRCTGWVTAIDPKPSSATLAAGKHITDQWLDAILAAAPEGVERQLNPPSRNIIDPTSHRDSLSRHLGRRARPIVVCHPGSGGLSKCCPLESLERLMHRFAQAGWTAAWMIGPDEMERFGEAYPSRLRETAPVLYNEDVALAADWICGADAYIGNDAGMTHVAALVGVTTAALFGPTDARVWGPIGPRVAIHGFPAGPDDSDWSDRLASELMKRVAL